MNRTELGKSISRVKDIDLFNSDAYFKGEMDNIEDTFVKKPFRIALVGEFSTGKSTFINALIGRDLLLHATSEVTAAITNIHNVGRNDKRWNSCLVHFTDGKPFSLDDSSKLKDYTTVQSEVTDVVNTVSSVDYYIDIFNKDVDVIIVDTPGLNGTADGHRELTLQEVKRADFCIYLLGIRGLADTDKILLKEISYYQKNFIFVLNAIDLIKVSEGETKEEKIEAIRDFLNDEIFSSLEIKYEIFGVSALKGLVGKDKTIKRLYKGDKDELTDSQREVLYKESGMKELEEYLDALINTDSIDALVIERVQHMLVSLLNSAIEDLTERKKRIDYLKNKDGSTRELLVLEERLQYYIEAAEKNKEKVNNFIVSECGKIRKEFLDYLRTELTRMYEEYSKKLAAFKRFEDLEEYVKSNALNSELKVDADKIYDYVEGSITECLNKLLSEILIRIQEYLKGSQINTDEKKIDFVISKKIKRSDSVVASAESRLGEAKAKRDDAARKMNLAQRNREVQEKEQEEELVYYTKVQKQLNSTEKEAEYRLGALGPQPEVEEKERIVQKTVYVTVSRSGIRGWIADKLFGKKTKPRTKEVKEKYFDDTKRKDWVKKRDAIRASYMSEIEELKDEVDTYNNRIKHTQKIIAKSLKDEEEARRDLEVYQQAYEQEKKLLDDLRKKANTELLNTIRKSMKEQLEKYLDYNEGEIASVIRDYVETTIGSDSKIICEKASGFYENRMAAMINVYKNEIEGKAELNEQRFKDYSEEITLITQIKEELENAG